MVNGGYTITGSQRPDKDTGAIMISAAQIDLVQASFLHCIPIPDEVAANFYGRLFARAPATRALFTGDMAEQGRKLVMTLAVVVDALDRLDHIVPIVEDLAIRHVRYGVLDAHYALVGGCLIETLRELLGPLFDPPTEAAWAAAYALLSSTMIAATRRAA